MASTLRRGGATVLGLDLGGDPQGDVAACDLRDARQLAAVTHSHELAAIVHCGAVSGPALHRDDPGHVARTNIESTVNLLELAVARGVPRFVFASSAAVYGRTPEEVAVDEERPLHPTSVYAATKVAGEALVEAFSRQYGLSGVSLRIAAVYGPGRRTPCVIRDMILAGKAERPVTLPHGRDQRYHYIHVEDVAEAVVAAVRVGSIRKPAYTIAADRGVTMGELAELVRTIIPGPSVVVGAADDPLSDPQGAYDLDAAAADLGWRARIALPEGIRSYAAALLQET
ncbi:NAD(P)-dependent oxidoreductase (plasmid) [Shinella sp. PSBB067]|uniref:NAD-dependent epimerase/dehydratase family protein n=1 Tax=Shinella sp. PSBB067 TaxID=2715959 RepID=UPI00193C7F15|nr:NAD(P)-dependent oxidoreductase [Shinella sp. PSBB067]QRI66256.1 NAD(P)-dependent oxidoreductase [Shinella sp. PSBB067]